MVRGNLFNLEGKVALITGSSKGIGKAIAEELARHGAQVVISSRKGDVCQEVAAAINTELEDEPGRAVAIPAHPVYGRGGARTTHSQ